VMGDVIDALQHRTKRRELGWSESAELIDVETELPMYWYLRGDFAAPAGSEILSDGAVITGLMTAQQAKALAENLNAKALLPVLR